MYSEARNDAKLRHLEDREHRIWFNLLCFSSEQDERGTIPVKNQYLLAVEVAGGDDEALKKTIEKLKMLDIVEVIEDKIIFTHFGERQYDNPSDRPDNVKERVAKHRAKKKNESKTKSNDYVTTCNETDTEAEADTELDSEINKDATATGASPSAIESSNSPDSEKKDYESFYSAHNRIWRFECNPLQAEKLAAYIDQDGMEEQVIIRAMERAALKGTGYKFGLITKILNDYAAAKVKTIAQAIALDNEFEKNKKISPSNRGQPPKKDLPDYVQRQIERRTQGETGELDHQQQKQALDLLLQLGEIDQEQYRIRMGRLQTA